MDTMNLHPDALNASCEREKESMNEGQPAQHGQFLVCEAEDGRIKIDVRFEGETAWLTQAMLAELFQTSQQNISRHVLNIYEEEELPPEATHKKFLLVRQEGSRSVKRLTDFYNLDMIISVGYRVKSQVATRFRIWATQRLREYIVKGFVLDDERLKNPQQPFDYFEELTRRIQDIRTSERRFYQKITDIYATSIDYDPPRMSASSSSRRCRTRCTGPSRGRPPPRSSIPVPMPPSPTWV